MTAALKSPSPLEVGFGLETVAVIQRNDARRLKYDTIIGPFARTPENVRYCLAIVEASDRVMPKATTTSPRAANLERRLIQGYRRELKAAIKSGDILRAIVDSLCDIAIAEAERRA